MSDTNNNLSLFNFQGHNIRIIIRNGEPWFVAKDVCEVLGIANHRDAIASLPEHQKDYVGIPDAIDRERITVILSEAALYKLAFRSSKAEAEVFTDWVTSVVLPTIRKTGRYSLTQEEPQKPNEQLSQWLNWDPNLLRSLSRDEYICLIQYERTRLSFLETIYNYKYPQVQTYEYPQEEHQPPHPVETIVIPPVDAKINLQTILLEYLYKTGTSVTVRHLQQSGPRMLRNLPADQLRAMLQALVTSGVLTTVQVGKAEHYRLL
jgi:prophage antirepressor-like protein